MKIPRPRHGTVVAYLALFAALGGTALAARNDTGAKEMKTPVVREERRAVPAGPTAAIETLTARCRSREQFLSGSGGWEATTSALSDQPAIRSLTPLQRTFHSKPKGIVVTGSNPPGFANTLVAYAICLPK